MPGKGSKNHIHKYHKIDMLGQSIWACALPDCTHYMPKHMEHFIPGKVSICWACSSHVMLDEHTMQMDRPICLKCELKERNVNVDEIESLL
jgi:hypothetical protein